MMKGKFIFAVFTLAFLSVVRAQSPASPTDKKPNILVIFGDDIGQTNVSAYSMGASRAIILSDAEAFQKAAVGLEHAAQVAGAPIGMGLAKSREYLFTLLQPEGTRTRDIATALFDVVREARNMAVHEGAWVRHRSVQLAELLLILEEAALDQLRTVEFVMVKSVITAEPWHSLARARRAMLTYSFSFLPVNLNGWHLLSDRAIVAITRTVGTGRTQPPTSTVGCGGRRETSIAVVKSGRCTAQRSNLRSC